MQYDTNNKVYLCGKLLTKSQIKYDHIAGQNLLTFVLGVPRESDLYNRGYNTDKYNYFYCYLQENIHTLVELEKFKNKLTRFAEVEIKGCLDNRLADKSVKSTSPRYRSLNCFVSTINVLAVNKHKDERPKEEINIERNLLNKVKNTFGLNADIKIEDGAYNLDYFGFDKQDDLPDY